MKNFKSCCISVSLILFFNPFVFSQLNEKLKDTNVVFEHLPPLSQALSSSCWSFAATSFIEAEYLRIYHEKINLSEQWFVYWDFIDKAKLFATQKKGFEVPIGSELNSVTEHIKKNGVVPFDAFKGTQNVNNWYDYLKMYEKFKKEVEKQSGRVRYNPKKIKNILNETMGFPPDSFLWSGVYYTPKSFLKDIVKFNPNDYFSFMSTNTLPFNQRGELVESDNWWNSSDYYNLSINDFFKALCEALSNGYTVALCGDVSEKEYQVNGKSKINDSLNLNSIDSLRAVFQLNGLTTNDHCWHVVGYKIENGEWWFLIKDSSYINPKDSYHWIHQSYVLLKAMSMMMHKYAARSVINTIIK